MKPIFLFLSFMLLANLIKAQQHNNGNEIYIDSKGIIRQSENGKEAAYFGVNYTLPFAYGYRSHKKLNLDLEKSIDKDVYHMARLGINAFRVHVWDTEISDSLGNLKNNEHLRLLDYLIAKLEARNIHIILTPIAFWGNGYPDKDDKTGSFVEKYGKNGAVVKEGAFLAQERYLDQFFRHVNPYTHKTYGRDRFVLATEINNEPHHSGTKSLATSYVNRMLKAIRNTGWSKPVFYNISESPAYADAVAASDVQGFSFQWYPTGLVAGHRQKGNLLPMVDRYVIPFDTIPAFQNKARMIYEFESADVMQPYMYPAMARSFKTAGFQWATQFAYDPLGTAYANTEYQTHYLNLVYTPAKAISLLIAAKVFTFVPLHKSYGSYPADTTFGPFKLSYKLQNSEMNADTAFYYANGSTSIPKKISVLKHVAGVGSSTVVQYSGSGAYFLDKIGRGYWRLEVMPDADVLSDPFGSNDLRKTVTQAVERKQNMEIRLNELGSDFLVTALNSGNTFKTQVVAGKFDVKPGSYLLRDKRMPVKHFASNTRVGLLGLNEYVAPDQLQYTGLANIPVQPNGHEAAESVLFDPAFDEHLLTVYSPDWKTDPYYVNSDSTGKMVLKVQHKASGLKHAAVIQVFIGDKLQSLQSRNAKTLVIRASADQDIAAKITWIDQDAVAYSVPFMIYKSLTEIRIPFSSLKKDSYILLPRPYPSFQKLNFSVPSNDGFRLDKMEKLQISFPKGTEKPFNVEILDINLAAK